MELEFRMELFLGEGTGLSSFFWVHGVSIDL